MGLFNGWLIANNKRDDFLVRVNDMIDWKPHRSMTCVILNLNGRGVAWREHDKDARSAAVL
jgi:hypothetical protein